MNTEANLAGLNQTFAFRGQNVRTVTKDGEPWFVAKDVCDVLGLGNITRALDGLDEDELTLLKVRAGGQHREMNSVSESGLYALIFKSRKPEAKAFRKWVTSEVLPALRKTGSYAMPKAPEPAPCKESVKDGVTFRYPTPRGQGDYRN